MDMRNNWMLEHLRCCIGLITTEDINLIKYNRMALLKVNIIQYNSHLYNLYQSNCSVP